MTDITLIPDSRSQAVIVPSNEEPHHSTSMMGIMVALALLSDSVGLLQDTLVGESNGLKRNSEVQVYWEDFILNVKFPLLKTDPAHPLSPEDIEKNQELVKEAENLKTVGQNCVMTTRQTIEGASARLQGHVDNLGQWASAWSSLLEKEESLFRALKDMTRTQV